MLAFAWGVGAASIAVAADSPKARAPLRDYVQAHTSSVAHGHADRTGARDILTAATLSLSRSGSGLPSQGAVPRVVLAGVLLGVIDHSSLQRASGAEIDTDVTLVLQLMDERAKVNEADVPRRLLLQHTWDVLDIGLATAWATRADQAPAKLRLHLLNKVRLAAPGTTFEEAAWRQSIMVARQTADMGSLWEFVDRYTARFPSSTLREQTCRDAIEALVRQIRDDDTARLPSMLVRRRSKSDHTKWLMLLLAERALISGRFALADIGLRTIAELESEVSDFGQRYRFFKMALATASADATHTMVSTPNLAPPNMPEALVRQVNQVRAAQARVGSRMISPFGGVRPEGRQSTAKPDVRAAVAQTLNAAVMAADEVDRD